MRTLSIALTCLLLVAALQHASQAQDSKPALRGVAACNEALKLLDKGQPQKALEVMLAAKGTMDAEDEWLWWGNTGHCYRDLRKDSEALTHYAKAVELEPDCWFRWSWCRLLHEFGRWDVARPELDRPIDPDYADRAERLKSVIDGPFKQRWPHAYRKLEHRSKKGNYVIVSDVGVSDKEMDALEAQAAKLDPSKKSDAAKLEKLLKPHNDLVSLANLAELARDEFMRFTALKESKLPKGKVFKVFFFMNEQDFHDFAAQCGGDGDTENTLGFYEPNLKYLQLYSQPGQASKVCGLAVDTVDTFFHEGWHQFFDMLTEQTPVWVDEGLAEFLGHAKVTNKGAKIELGLLIRARGDTYTRYERIRESTREGKHVPFTRFFKYTREEWDSGDINIHYAQAWSISYYALKGDNPAFTKDYSKLFWELVEGRHIDEVVAEIFPDDKLEKYEQAWLAYWKKT